MSCQKNETVQLNTPMGGDFSLPTTKGVFFSENHRGKVIFLFFGFTHCPQICPKTLSQLNLMAKRIPKSERDKVEILFVSVDTKRDNLDVLEKRLSSYSNMFKGASTTEVKLREMMAKFGATYTVYQGKDPDDLAIDHTSDIFVINDKGTWVNSLKYDSTSDELLAAYKSANQMSPVYAKHRQNRTIEVFGDNKECDLSKSVCKIDHYEVSLSPLPIVANKNYTVKVVSHENQAEPMEVDFEGIEQNMGYIRPKLMRTDSQTFSGNFYIPTCELPQMQWRARLILKSTKAMNFYFMSSSLATE